MRSYKQNFWSTALLIACGLLSVSATGCQSTVGGQTLPSAYYLDDDVQYFPAGPEFKLSNLSRRLEEYRVEQEAFEEGLAPEQSY